MPSLKDIAAVCGVSVATVSKALSDQKDIGEVTKKRVRQAAKEMGYLPNAAAQALKTNRSYNIGVLFVDDDQSGLTHDYFNHVLDSFKKTVEQQGYDITFINSNRSGKTKMSFLEHARYRGFDGVIIACIDFGKPEVQELIDSEIPLVTIDKLFKNRIAVLSDNIEGMESLVKYAYSMGHRKIAYISGAESAVTKARLESFYRTAETLGLKIPDKYVRQAEYRSTKHCYSLTKELLALPDPPTCILYPDDFASLGGIDAITDMGLSIPGDISIAGYDGIRIGRHIKPRLTTFRQDTEEVGRVAAEALVGLIERPKSAIVRPLIVRGLLYEGESVGRLQ